MGKCLGILNISMENLLSGAMPLTESQWNVSSTGHLGNIHSQIIQYIYNNMTDTQSLICCRNLSHTPVLENNALDCILWVGGLSGPAGHHLQVNVPDKGVVGLEGQLEVQDVVRHQGDDVCVAVCEGLVAVHGHGQAQHQRRVNLHHRDGGKPIVEEIVVSF